MCEHVCAKNSSEYRTNGKLFRINIQIGTLPIGYPIAKSLLCVQNIAKIPARPTLTGLPTNNVTIITAKNTILFAINIDNKNSQLTADKSNSANDMKINDGKANVPTNVFIPFASVSEIKFIRPAK